MTIDNELIDDLLKDYKKKIMNGRLHIIFDTTSGSRFEQMVKPQDRRIVDSFYFC